MADTPDWPRKAYKNNKFLHSKDARGLRILSEYMEPEARFEEFQVRDTVVFFGSARFVSRDEAKKRLKAAQDQGSDVTAAERDLEMSAYYEAARELAGRLTEWSKNLEGEDSRFIVCSGGGPGIMEAANQGASEAAGINAGLNISLPHEQAGNPYITRDLNFEFHYFFMRKFWFIYLAKAIVIFPGGFGTMDEFFEVMTLMQTGKLTKPIPIVLYGSEFWNDVLNLDALVMHGTVDTADLDLFFETNSVDEAFDFITTELIEKSLGTPGGVL
ncbi:MAG: lysine decarboxylase [Rhodospirillaceae bacterium]|nr:lysine decarboxylase [Rhodospirillaceae bacterium]